MIVARLSACSYNFIFHIYSFSSPEPTILLACGRNRELWEQPFWNNKGNNRILPIRFNSVFIYGACPKWLLPELLIPAAGQKDRRLWGREWYLLWPCTCTCHYYTVDLLKYLTSLIFLSIFFDLTYSLGRNSFKLSQGKQNNSMLLSAIHIVCAMARIDCQEPLLVNKALNLLYKFVFAFFKITKLNLNLNSSKLRRKWI